jgi:hypothetical protein
MSAWGLGGAFNKLPSTRLNSGSLVGSVLAMDIFLLRVFQSQVALQCQFLLAAANEVNVALKERNTERTFYALQNLLNAGANISKALWGAGGKFADQRKPLRDSIGIDDSSPLREVTMRNNFEHFDERLDRWWKESKHHNHMDLIIGPAATTIVGHEETDKFRHFDPTTCNMVFWGQEFNLQTIVTEVQKILPKLQAEANKPNWETTPATPKV